MKEKSPRRHLPCLTQPNIRVSRYDCVTSDHYAHGNSVYVAVCNAQLRGTSRYNLSEWRRFIHPPRRTSPRSGSPALFFPPLSGSKRDESPVAGRSLSVQKQTALVATAKRHEGNRLETTSGSGGDGGHEEIASLPSNDVTTNANLITAPDIANRPGPVAVVVRRGFQYRGARRPVSVICKQIEVRHTSGGNERFEIRH